MFRNHGFYHKHANSEQLIDDLIKLNIRKNCGCNWCQFEDGSITVSNPDADMDVGNGIEYKGNKHNADILYISPDGVYTEI